MNGAFAIQIAASAAAVAVMVGIAAWAKIARPTPPLDEARARALLALEFPGRSLDGVWLAADGCGALAKSGAMALVLCQMGDGYVARQVPWAQALAASFKGGRITLDLADVGAPKAVLTMAAWPPEALEKGRPPAKDQAA
jgi:hypothetical protein